MNRLIVILFILMSGLSASAVTHIVQARNFFYLPSDITIDLSDTVRFIRVEGSHPTVSTTGDFTGFPLDAANPTFDLVLTSGGFYPYECTLHAGLGMVGSITVNSSSAPCSLTTGPSGLTASAGSTTVSLGWDVLPNAVAYQVQGKKVGTGPYGAAISMTNSKTIGGLTPSITYQWKVRALCDLTDEITPFSPIKTFTTSTLKIADEATEHEQLIVTQIGAKLVLTLPEAGVTHQADYQAKYSISLYTLNGSLAYRSYVVSSANQLILELPSGLMGHYLIEANSLESDIHFSVNTYLN